MPLTQAPLHLMGWNDDPGRHVVAAPFGRLFTVSPALARVHTAGDVMLYKAWTDVLGKHPPYVAQEIGDCTSHSHGHSNDLLQCVEAALAGSVLKPLETLTEFTYAAGREVGGMLGPQDGCVGVYVAKAMLTIGMLPRSVVSSPPYDGKRAKAWGMNGAPADLKAMAAAHKLGAATLCKSWDEMVAALMAGYPVNVCSSQGFTMERNSEGICEAQGSWMHSMAIVGRLGETAVIIQSWGPDTPSGPLVMDMPSYSFRARRNVVEGMLRQGDSFALSTTSAFAVRDLPATWTYQNYV